jgi:hypothetical protein
MDRTHNIMYWWTLLLFYFLHVWVLTAGLSWFQYMYVLFMRNLVDINRLAWCNVVIHVAPYIFLHTNVFLIVFLLEHFCPLPVHHSQLLIIVYFINSWLTFWILLVQISVTWHVNLQDWKAFWKVDSGISSGNLLLKLYIKHLSNLHTKIHISTIGLFVRNFVMLIKICWIIWMDLKELDWECVLDSSRTR